MDTLSPTETALSRLASELLSLGYTATVAREPYVKLAVAENPSLRSPDVRGKGAPSRETYYVWDGRAYRSPKTLAKTLATFLRSVGILPSKEAAEARAVYVGIAPVLFATVGRISAERSVSAEERSEVVHAGLAYESGALYPRFLFLSRDGKAVLALSALFAFFAR